MTRFAIAGCVLLLILGFGTNVAPAEEIVIQVSPSTINLAYEGTEVTVHAEIPYGEVALEADLTLNGVLVCRTKADARGDLVAKFDVDSVKGIFTGETLPASAELELMGETLAGTFFHGIDTVRVINQSGKR
jgi:hypothetical protein